MRTVVISSPIATQSGYGHHAREVVTNFFENKPDDWDIKLLSMPWGHTPYTYPIPLDWQKRIIPLPLTQKPDIWVQITVPTEFQSIANYNIGVTAGTEGDICPPEWIDHINKMQLVIVPSNFTKKVFEDTAKQHNKSITTNLQVISEYFDDNTYDNKNVTAKIPVIDQQIKESFVFLTVGHWLSGNVGEDRKNLGATVHCFFDTFKNNKNQPALLLKTSGATYSVVDRHDIESKINQVRDMFPKTDRLPSVYLLHGDLTNKEMNTLYNHPKVKAMVSFNKGEGFGRPLLEFGLSKKPIIASGWSGQLDFLNPDYTILIPGKLEPVHQSAANKWLLPQTSWFAPDVTQMSRVFKNVYEKYKSLVGKAKQQGHYVKTNFSFDHMKELVGNILDSNLPKFAKKMDLSMPTDIKFNTDVQLPKLK